MADKRTQGRKADLSDVAALEIIRSGLDPNKKATALDWDKILSVVGGRGKPPDNAFTAQQHADKSGMEQKAALTLLTKAAKDGKIGTGMYMDPETSRVSRFFWLK